jgi:hypothetical protein
MPPQLSSKSVRCFRQNFAIWRCCGFGNAASHSAYAFGSTLGGTGSAPVATGGGGIGTVRLAPRSPDRLDAREIAGFGASTLGASTFGAVRLPTTIGSGASG